MADDDIADSWEDWEDSGELDRKKTKTPVSPVKKPQQLESQALAEDSCRTAYQPQVRILKRDPDNSSLTHQDGNKSALNSKPTKSLEEREAAYAEARLRILGTAGVEDQSTDQRPSRLVQQLEEVRVSDNVIRQPLGPDGGPGFQQKHKP